MHIANSTLNYDPATQQKLLAFEGKSILWQADSGQTAREQTDQSEQPSYALNNILISVTNTDNLATLKGSIVEKKTEASVYIYGSIGVIAGLLLDQNQSPQQAGLRIEGDLRFLNALRSVLDELDIDWEAALASKLGDNAGHFIGQFLSSKSQQAKAFAEGLPDYIHDMLTEELRSCAHRYELQTFYDEVDALQSDCTRLEARIDKLAKR